MALLDLCDEHRDEGSVDVCSPLIRLPAPSPRGEKGDRGLLDVPSPLRKISIPVIRCLLSYPKNNHYLSLTLIPVLVTGIQCAHVHGRGGCRLSKDKVSHHADAWWLDSCDKHRNEGGKEEESRHAPNEEGTDGSRSAPTASPFFASFVRQRELSKIAG
jgi:hypothetical protein